jgi:glycosyltransferase involved in cell wall biosynthesis
MTADVDVDVVVPTSGRPSLTQLLERLGDLKVIVVEDRERRGAAWARNQGWRRSRAEWIAFLDDDVLPDRNWPEQLREDLASAALFGGTLAALGQVLETGLLFFRTGFLHGGEQVQRGGTDHLPDIAQVVLHEKFVFRDGTSGRGDICMCFPTLQPGPNLKQSTGLFLNARSSPPLLNKTLTQIISMS